MRASVPLKSAFKLLNHGPTVLVSAAAKGKQNVMAAAWAMPLDFDPPKVSVVIAQDTFTRSLVEASGELCVSVPTTEQVDLTWAVGSVSGNDVEKASHFGLTLTAGSCVSAPLVEGCAAWLECKVIPEPGVQERYDLFVAEVVAAWADDALFQNGEWRFTTRRTLHHMSRGVFFATGERIEAKKIF